MNSMPFDKNNFQNNIDNTDTTNYWISFTDILSGLLVIFLLITVVLIINLIETKNRISRELEKFKKSEKVRKELLVEIKNNLDAQNIKVEIHENYTTLRIPDRTLSFVTDSDLIPEDKMELLRKIGVQIYTSITKDNRISHLNTVFIEGHTDSRTSMRPKGNWGLSTFRAISTWTFWEKTLAPKLCLSKLKNYENRPLFSVSGYADSRRICQNEITKSDYRANRRIDIRFTIKGADIGKLSENLVGNYGIDNR